ncbi:pentapeptide repeat-containing protein [Rhodococcus qingshengii]|uniref:pentapeptide repeat-containing protein n=1 Tax=Rhodococcus qingshengii TaxID=334542 RepID=UPI0035D7F107
MSTPDEAPRPDPQPATDEAPPVKPVAEQSDAIPPSAPDLSATLPEDESDWDIDPSKLSWLAIFGVILGALAILLCMGAVILTVDFQPGQGTVLGGTAVLVGGGLTYLASHQKRASDERIEALKYRQTARQIRLAEKEAGRARAEFEQTLQAQLAAQNAAAERELNRELRARFATATTLLSSGAYAAQLTGVHELAALADDWAEFGSTWERQVCIDLLCAQLRTPRVSKSDKRARIEDDQFRTGIIRVIRGRTEMHPDNGDGLWQDCNFDLSDAELPKIELQNCRFRGELNFQRTTFSGLADFSGSHLGNARFDNSIFANSAKFRSATFGLRVSFALAVFGNNASFHNAKFVGTTDFSNSVVEDASLQISSARFKLGSQTVFRFMELKGSSVLDFSSAWFSGGKVELRNMTISPSSKVVFIHPRALKSLPRVDWEDSAAVDLPHQIEPREWPPTPFTQDEPGPKIT